MSILQALQTSLAAQTVSERYARAYEVLEHEHGGCAARLQAAHDALEKERRAFDKFASRVKTLEHEMHDSAQRAITQQVMKARVETMFEFQRGELTTNDLAETVRIYNNAYPGDSFPTGTLRGYEAAGQFPDDNSPGDKQV